MNDINKKEVGERIKKIRMNLGLSMEEFGEILDTSKGAVNNWEKGKNLPNNKRLKDIMTIGKLNSIDELLYGSLGDIIYKMMKEFQYYPDVYELSKEEFVSKGKTMGERAFLRNVYTYATYMRYSHPEELPFTSLEEDATPEELEEYYFKKQDILDKEIWSNTLKIAKSLGLTPNDKYQLANILSSEAVYLFSNYERNENGLKRMALDTLDNAIDEISNFSYGFFEENKNLDTSIKDSDIAMKEAIFDILNATRNKIKSLKIY